MAYLTLWMEKGRMHKQIRRIVGTVAVMGLAACAANAAGAGGNRANSDVITREQVEATHFNNALDVVRSLHSNWLNVRGVDTFIGTPTQVQVYLDGTKMSGVDALQTIPALNIFYIRHYNAREATARWGLDHGAGAIYVSTQPQA